MAGVGGHRDRLADARRLQLHVERGIERAAHVDVALLDLAEAGELRRDRVSTGLERRDAIEALGIADRDSAWRWSRRS